MKKLFLLVLFFIIFPLLTFAQNYDPEKIYLFDAHIDVQTNGEIMVTENITVNVRHQDIRRGIYRDLPNLFNESATPISLTMDGEKHPFFTEYWNDNLRVNFGDDNYIEKGKHTYSFKYSYIGAIDSLNNYDELYWNVTGNDWDFTIDKARVTVNFPQDVNIIEQGISLYTGYRGEKGKDAKQVSTTTFETTSELDRHAGFTISIPFEKGVIQQPTLLSRLKVLHSVHFYIALIMFIALALFYIITWYKVGRDPHYTVVTQYDAPHRASPAFLSYIKSVSHSKMLSCAILDLAMKGYLQIKEEGKSIILIRKQDGIKTLAAEEKLLLEKLFENTDTCKIDKKAGKILESIGNKVASGFRKIKDEYKINNIKYILKAYLFAVGLGVIPFIGATGFVMIIFNAMLICPFLSLLAFAFIAGRKWFLTLCFLALCIFITISVPGFPLYANVCECIFIIGIFMTALYMLLIPNVTPKGKEFFEHLKGFEKYLNTAEAHRTKESYPADTERIFCEYLPYAFALNLYNQWMNKFTDILSEATIQKCMECAGGTKIISSRLENCISNSWPSYGGGSSSSSSGHSGGSFGGGSSGGGHGGGGGGGR